MKSIPNGPHRGPLRAGDGTLVGWRYWRILRALPDLLISPFQQSVWEGPVLTAHAWSTHAAVEGFAGIHAAHTQRQARQFAAREREARRGLTSTATVAVGRVRGFGKHVIGVDGWRAQHVIVDKLFIVPFPAQHVASAIAAFEKRYDCTVRVDLRFESPLTSELCMRCGHAKSQHRFPPLPVCDLCGSHGPCGLHDGYRLAIIR